jgi:gas vesicle protein
MNNRNLRNEGTEKTGWSSFISGALIGGGVALLLAPQSGTELRGMLSNYANRAKEDLLEKAEEVYDNGEEVVRDAGRSAKEFAQQGQETVQDAGRSAKEFAKQTQMAREPGRSAL